MNINFKIFIILILFLIFIIFFIPFSFCSFIDENNKISLGVSSYDDNEYFLITDDGEYSPLNFPYYTISVEEEVRYFRIGFMYSNSPILLEKTSDYEITKSYNALSTNDDFFWWVTYFIYKDDINDFIIDLNSLSPEMGPSTGTKVSGMFSSPSHFLFSTFDVKEKGTNELLFAANSSEDDNNINDKLNDILSSSNIDSNTITDNIANSDWSSSLNENDKTLIEGAPKEVSKGFSGILSLFDFIDNVKSAIINVYNLIEKSSDVDFYHDSSYNIDFAPHISLDFNNKYLKGTYKIFDFAWYIPYKKYGDAIITAFVYIAFIVHVFKNLPNYVSGANSVSSNISVVMSDNSNNKNKS